MRTSREVVGMMLGVALLLGACGAEPTPTPAPACPTQAPTSAEAQSIVAGIGSATVSVRGGVEGEFTIELLPDAAPIATANFVSLARCGFYDGIWFHRVLDGFVIQAGDPGTRGRSGDFDGLGTGGPPYRFEIEPVPAELDYVHYSVAMANDRVANGSQFFVSVADLRGRLAKEYTIFGQVVSGTAVVDAIAVVPVNDPQMGVPLSLVVIESIVVGGDAETG